VLLYPNVVLILQLGGVALIGHAASWTSRRSRFIAGFALQTYPDGPCLDTLIYVESLWLILLRHDYKQWLPISLLLSPSGLVFRPDIGQSGNSGRDVGITQHFDVNVNKRVSNTVRIFWAGTYDDFRRT
jgi:hypothetical protein